MTETTATRTGATAGMNHRARLPADLQVDDVRSRSTYPPPREVLRERTPITEGSYAKITDESSAQCLPGRSERVSEPFSADTFEPHVGTNFRVGGGELALVEVVRYGRTFGAPRADPFTLRFELAEGSGGALDQRIHRLRHEVLGEVELFLVPIGPTSYEAVFN